MNHFIRTASNAYVLATRAGGAEGPDRTPSPRVWRLGRFEALAKCHGSCHLVWWKLHCVEIESSHHGERCLPPVVPCFCTLGFRAPR